MYPASFVQHALSGDEANLYAGFMTGLLKQNATVYQFQALLHRAVYRIEKSGFRIWGILLEYPAILFQTLILIPNPNSYTNLNTIPNPKF